MSEDRFKQARRSLIDRHNQRQQQAGHGGETFDGDFEDEATAMVNLDQAAPFAPPPNFQQPEESTELFSIDQSPSAPQPGGVQMRTSGLNPSAAPPPTFGSGSSFDSAPVYSPPATQPAAVSGSFSSASDQHRVALGDDLGYEGHTQFVNLNDFASENTAAGVTPDTDTAGYEGHTQFVNLTELQAEALQQPQGAPSIEHDAILLQSYQFGPESVQHGEFTLVFAQSAMGRPVILKRIWEGDPTTMPPPVRQRLAALDQIRHPNLVGLNGMLTTETGAWVELNRPPGYRLTDILAQNGPQPKEAVMGWIQQAAGVLGLIHGHQFVYANLTTDAIWVQEDGSVQLEPFDILSFEHRGTLDAFGPPEMQVPPEQRQLFPASDVYSLAAVAIAALTGVPLNLNAVTSLDKKLSGVLISALNPNPAERPHTMQDFVAGLGKGAGKSGGLPDLDFKFVLIGVAALGMLALGGVYAMQNFGQADPPPPVPDEQAATPGEDPAKAGGDAGAAAAAAPAAATSAEDPRISIQTSFALNPPEAAVTGTSNEGDLEQADAMRAEAREALVGIEKLVEAQQRDKYTEALTKVTTAIRISGEMTKKDKQLLEELFEQKVVQEVHKDYFVRVNKLIGDKKLSRVRQAYMNLSSVEPDAKNYDYFDRNKNADFTVLKRTSGGAGASDN